MKTRTTLLFLLVLFALSACRDKVRVRVKLATKDAGTVTSSTAR